jgi:hypothetical protein
MYFKFHTSILYLIKIYKFIYSISYFYNSNLFHIVFNLFKLIIKMDHISDIIFKM